MKISQTVVTIAAIFAALVVLALGCGPEQLTSQWAGGASAAGPDWARLSAYQIKDLRTTVALANDADAFYVRISSQNRHLTRSLRRVGMTLWLTNPRDEKERVGIHYPIGMQPHAPGARPERMLPEGAMPPGTASEFLQPNEDVELLSKDSTLSGVKTLAQAEDLGIRSQLTEADSTAEYTLRARFEQMPSWLRAGSKVLLKMESAAFVKMEERRGGEGERGEHGGMGRHGRGGGGMPPGGGEGGMGGPHGGWGGGRRGGDHEGEGIRPEKVQTFQFMVTLSAAPK